MAPVALRFFYLVGPAFAIWAVVLAVIGLRRPDFPRSLGVERAVIAISAALLLTVILSATIGAKWEHSEQAKAGPDAHDQRGSPTP